MYKRVLLKLSGEALAGEKKTGIDPEVVDKICEKEFWQGSLSFWQFDSSRPQVY